MTYLDSHTAIWLFDGAQAEFSGNALQIIDTHELRISPVVLFEISVLQEIGRIRNGPEDTGMILLRDYDVSLCPTAFHKIVEAAYSEKWTRDLFDRLLVAHARVAGGKLLTKDRRIHANFDGAVW